MTTVDARIRMSSSSSAMFTPQVSVQEHQRLETTATVRPPRANRYSWSAQPPLASRSSGPGTSTLKLQWTNVKTACFTTAGNCPWAWIS